MKRNGMAAAVIGVFLLAVIGLFSYSSISAADDAVNFSFPGLDGKDVTLADYRGKVVIVDVWATWCPPCRQEIPGFINLQKKFESEGLMILGLAVDEDGKTAVEPFAKEYGINYPLALTDMQAVQKIFGPIRGIPTTFLIDQNGKIVNKYVGFHDEATFEKAFKALKAGA